MNTQMGVDHAADERCPGNPPGAARPAFTRRGELPLPLGGGWRGLVGIPAASRERLIRDLTASAPGALISQGLAHKVG